MRISFPNKEQDDVLFGVGEVRIGAATDNNIVITDSGVAPHHLRLKLSERNMELAVSDAQARTHVNTRPVREKAVLRLGDVVSVGAVSFVIKPDRDTDIRTTVPPAPTEPPFDARPNLPPRVVLRGLSGTHFGKIVPVRGWILVGRGGRADLNLDEPNIAARHAIIAIGGNEIALHVLGEDGNVQVNGIAVRSAILQAGDQICFGHERFLIEAPGLPQRSAFSTTIAARGSANPTITQTMRAISFSDDEPFAPKAKPPAFTPSPAPAPKRENYKAYDEYDDEGIWIWLLIAVAAIIAAGLALVLLGII
jgi:pSer/pThr/pTyr-binding forkhead associated (FHA) protein